MGQKSQNLTTSSQPENPWDRRKGEGARPWRAFREYLKRRDHPTVAERVGSNVRTIHNYSSKWDWDERCKAWDAAQARAEDEAVQDRRAALAIEHLEHWGALRKLAMSEAVRLLNESKARGPNGKPGVISDRTLVQIVNLATKNERLVIGEVTERTEQVDSEWDMSKLDDDEIALLAKLHRKATT